MTVPREAARTSIPTAFGEFEARAFELSSRTVYVALVRGDPKGSGPVLVRLHSECLTGDALGSRRCDCGEQLEQALRMITAEGRGILVYATGQEGRGIGLVNKLRAYAEQDRGADTVDANLRLGLPVDGRTYGEAAAVLRALGVRTVRLLTNNPTKVAGLTSEGVAVVRVEPLPTAASLRNVSYLATKRQRLGHRSPAGTPPPDARPSPPDVAALVGRVRPRPWRPYVVVKYAQTLDGRIATASGDSRWISGEEERRVSHALRAACDAVLVGVGTVLRDDCRLTVRMIPGPSPMRIVLDSRLRIPITAAVLDHSAATVVIATDRAPALRRRALAARGTVVRLADAGPGGVDVRAVMRELRDLGVRSLLVEGGARVITSMLAAGVVDRVVVGVAPLILGAGTEAIGDLGVARVREGLVLADRSLYRAGEDLLVAGDIRPRRAEGRSAESDGGVR